MYKAFWINQDFQRFMSVDLTVDSGVILHILKTRGSQDPDVHQRGEEPRTVEAVVTYGKHFKVAGCPPTFPKFCNL